MNLNYYSLSKAEILFTVTALSCAMIGFPSNMSFLALGVFSLSVCFFTLFTLFKCKKIVQQDIFFIFIIIITQIYLFSTFIQTINSGMPLPIFMTSIIGPSVLYFLLPLLLIKLDKAFLVKIMVLVSVFWCFKILIANATELPRIISGGIRLTAIDVESIMPFPLVGLILVLFSPYINKRLQLPLATFFLFINILVGYKAVIVLSFLCFLIFFIKGRSFYWAVIFTSLGVGAILILMAFTPLGDYLNSRYASLGTGGETVRLHEIKETFNVFSEKPIFGAGLGLKVDAPSSEELPRNYIHNILFYYLATTGIIGVLLLSVLVLSTFYLNNNRYNYASLGIVLLLASALTAASFKLVQFNYLLVILLYLNYKRGDDVD